MSKELKKNRMRVEKLADIIGSDFFTGVPDSQLKALCDYLMEMYGIDSRHHIIAANEGNAVGLAAGYHLATGRVPVVYLQNSGEGNIINPLASLLNERVYAIPVIFIIGWRGEPGVYDEPQHAFQGEVTRKLLDVMGVESFLIGSRTREDELERVMDGINGRLMEGHSVAFIIQKGALTYEGNGKDLNENVLSREQTIEHIVRVSADDLVISTTGKASRELYEIRKRQGKAHDTDFLTVGSMGHCSSIALGVALNTEQRVWCIDGDGAALMHMGAMPVIADNRPGNLIHIVLNNGAHETVGGQPTVMGKLKFSDIARDCGYPYAVTVRSLEQLDDELRAARERNDLSLIEVKCGLGSRSDLGRPAATTIENKNNFMRRCLR